MTTWNIVVLIVGVIMGFSGIIFGIIKGEQARVACETKDAIIDIERKIVSNDVRIYGLESRVTVMERLDAIRHKNNGKPTGGT